MFVAGTPIVKDIPVKQEELVEVILTTGTAEEAVEEAPKAKKKSSKKNKPKSTD